MQFLDKGKPACESPEQWVSTLELWIGKLICTGVLIGPHVLMTAAHCVSDDYEFKIQFEPDPQDPSDPPAEKWQLECETHPAYADQGFRVSFDYALCFSDKVFPKEVEILPLEEGDATKIVPLLFERISLDPADLRIVFRSEDSHWLMLSGYGCTDPNQTKLDDRLRAGMARMSFNGPVRLTTGSPYRDDSKILCYGDSGGGAYWVSDRSNPYGTRMIVGINSEFMWETHRSYLAKTSAPAFIHFFNNWRRRRGNPKVCGVDRDIDNLCHA